MGISWDPTSGHRYRGLRKSRHSGKDAQHFARVGSTPKKIVRKLCVCVNLEWKTGKSRNGTHPLPF